MSEPGSKCLPRGAVTFLARSQNSNRLNYSCDSQGAAALEACVAHVGAPCRQHKEPRQGKEISLSERRAVSESSDRPRPRQGRPWTWIPFHLCDAPILN